ncbi:MAG TPA: hypothetical protein VFV63_05935, partial [Ilumatobacteraceae bacterium]|nr:hypothetical protein [Ilumatobacteraceae bacterium]
MGDEQVADADAMWKPGYSAPGGGGGNDDPEGDSASRDWFAGYRRREPVGTADQAALPSADPAS